MSYPADQGWPQQPAPAPQYAQPGTQWPSQPQGYAPQPPAFDQQYGGTPQAPAYAQQYAAPPAPQYAPPPRSYAPPQGSPYGAAMVDPNALRCRFCGCVPAARVKFRGHRGMIVMMTFLSLDGPFCRDCGLSTFRRMTASTLIAGWWGYASFLITPVTVVINLVRRGKVADLPAPVPPPNGPSQHPMDPGKPLLARPQAIIGLALPGTVFVLFLILMIIGAVTGGSS